MKRPDLLLLIAIWMFLTVIFNLIGIAAILIFAFPGIAFHAVFFDVGTVFGLSIAILCLITSAGISAAGGIGLLLGRNWGRILGIINAALSLFVFPIGTVIGVLVLIYLTKSEVREYFEGSH